ncbi:hypothetical protein PG996_003677 [Apiospora saccharicola]|uniref:Heat shock protein 30 n=1 Tax=Apiospora saccharicola TaxID=335842 RepID=A0ABR1W1X7_9PEZI
MDLIHRNNQALDINPPAGNEAFSVHGSDWLWAVTAIYTILFIAFYAASFKPFSGEKIFHYIFSVALLVESITYFAWASDLGYSVVTVVNSKPVSGWTRQIFWVKYVNWVVEFPAIILSLGLLSGVSWATIVYNIFLSWIWVVSYLVSAYTTSNYKWGFYAFGTVAWIMLAFNTLGHGGTSAKRVGLSRDHYVLSGWVNLLWLLYPIAFGLSDGGNTIGVTPSAIFFGVLDVLLVPVTSVVVLALSRKWDYGRLNLAFTRYGRVHDAGSFPEKNAPAAIPAPGVTAPPVV